MRNSSILFVIMLIASSLSAGCIGERMLHRFVDDDKDVKHNDCDNERLELLLMEIRATEEELNDDTENEELRKKLGELRDELALVSRSCNFEDEQREERGDEKCYDENRQEVECEDSSNSDDEEREEEKCYDEDRQEVECEESSESTGDDDGSSSPN